MTDQVEYTIEEAIGKRTARARFTRSGRESNVLDDLRELLDNGQLPSEEIEEDDGQLDDDIEVEIPDEEKPRVQKALMAVDQIEGSRGEEIVVRIRGGCPDPMMGFQFAMGYGQWLEVLEIEIGDFFKAYGGEHMIVSAENAVNGWPEPFIRVMCVLASIDPKAPKGIGGIKEPIPVPHGTTLATVRFKIPDSPGSMKQKLFMRRLWFKEKASDHGLLKVDCMYAAWRKRGGYIPITISGKVTVREGAVEDPAAAIAAHDKPLELRDGGRAPAGRPAIAEAPAAAPAPAAADTPAKPPHVTP